MNPIIKDAADKLNTITPLAVPQQTIQLGTFDCANNQFTWALTDVVQVFSLPGAGSSEDPGTGGIASHHPPPLNARVALINSYNVQYELNIQSRPPDFHVSLVLPGKDGSTTVEPIFNPSQTVVTISLNPYNTGYQVLQISNSGSMLSYWIKPRLQNQLGAFVIPHLLIAIVYEPPGRKSSATYEVGSTTGTIFSMTTAQTSGLITETDPYANQHALEQIISGIASAAGAYPISIVLGILEAAQFKEYLISQRTQITATTEENGTYFSVGEGFGTDPDDQFEYPGQGDVFVVMTDVLFMYVVGDDQVHLIPVAYDTVRKWVASELDANVPTALAQTFKMLDPNFNTHLMMNLRFGRHSMDSIRAFGGHSLNPVKPLGTDLAVPIPGDPTSTRFEYRDHTACDPHATDFFYAKSEDYQSSTLSRTQTETEVYRVSGLIAKLQGDNPDEQQLHSVSYTSSSKEVSSTEHTATITLQSADDNSEGSFDVLVYYDKLFRTFLGVKGAALDVQPHIAGIVTNSRGKPLPNEEVILQIGGARYAASTDHAGNFSFRYRAIPKDRGTLSVGSRTTGITYTGAPISGLKLSR